MPLEPFAYNAAAPLNIVLTPAHDPDEAAIAFDGDVYGRVTGALVRPAHPTGAAVLWVHWLGDAATTNHTEFLAEARDLARRGVTSLLVDAMWSRPDWFAKGRTPAGDERDLNAQVIALRRAIDVLAQQPGVDPHRIALVGHDFGAMYGALAAASDPRISDIVLMTPALTFWEWMLFGASPTDIPAYVAQMSAYDLPRRLPLARAHAILYQFGATDPYVSASTADAVQGMPGGDETVRKYPAGHNLALPAVRTERDTWLAAHLQF
jgi:predicted esterase